MFPTTSQFPATALVFSAVEDQGGDELRLQSFLHHQSGPGVAMEGTQGRRRWQFGSPVGARARGSSKKRNGSSGSAARGFYGRIAAHGGDPGMWPPYSELWLTGGRTESTRARTIPRATDVWGPCGRDTGTWEKPPRKGCQTGPACKPVGKRGRAVSGFVGRASGFFRWAERGNRGPGRFFSLFFLFFSVFSLFKFRFQI
jgi:hypothetical protein